MKAWPVLGILIVQVFLFLAHWFLYCTWVDFWCPLSPATTFALRVALVVLSVSFMVAALLGFRYSNWLVVWIYKMAAVWLGLLNFFFVAACLTWMIDLPLRLLLPHSSLVTFRPYLVGSLWIAAVVAGIYGMLNARWIRERKITIRLPNLPPSWRGRTALIFSDLHLGHINGIGFARRIAKKARQLNPDLILIPGDLFDGTRADPKELAAPLFGLPAPLGVYIVLGNHDEFGGAAHYTEAIQHGGMHVLDNERVIVDGLAVVGVSYHQSTKPLHLRAFLEGLQLGNGTASILLQHVPNRLAIAEQAGVSLQICGHTHGGQMFPFSWITHRAFGKFSYGLQKHGALQVYTSSGAGTWGPPMRVGTHPEIVLLTFE